MNRFKSIRWRLQLWYGLILVAVLAGFGFTAYQLERGNIFRQVDSELRRRIGAIGPALHPPPGRPGGRPFNTPPRGREPPPNGPDAGPPGAFETQPGEFHLPMPAADLFDPSDPNNYYFIITLRDGRELARSTNAPQVEAIWDRRPSAEGNTLPQLRPDPIHPVAVQTRGKFREMVQTLPPGTTIRVGCWAAPGQKELELVALTLSVVGAGILLFGLAGGWWLASRTIRPIADIGATAVRISAGDLSQRVNVADTDSELGQLAGVLNSTFARLEAAFAQQKQFTSDAAHELRTPVSVMLTQTQTALNRERSPAEYRETVEACQRAAQRMRRLIESLLELARLDAGQETMKRVRFDLTGLVNDCVALVRPLADERGISIHTELPALECDGDPERLAQVLTNLLTNAVRHNKDRGEVRIAGQSRDGMATLTVADTGQGIPESDLPRVFERFYRGDTSRSSAHTGLGLAIAKAIVEAHGGTIEVSSRPGLGATFTVRLPLA